MYTEISSAADDTDSQLQWYPDVGTHELIKYEHDEHMFKFQSVDRSLVQALDVDPPSRPTRGLCHNMYY